MKEKNELKLTNFVFKETTFTVRGTSDLCLNKPCNSVRRYMSAENRKLAAKQEKNFWEDMISSMHWKDPLPDVDLLKEASEAMLEKLLVDNAPCISAIGLKKSIGQAVVRSGADKYSTKLNACLNVIADRGLIPIRFERHYLESKMMSPQRGSAMETWQNYFQGWEADITIQYIEGVYTLSNILDFVNFAGFGLGIGSGRNSNYGRFYISKAPTDVREIAGNIPEFA